MRSEQRCKYISINIPRGAKVFCMIGTSNRDPVIVRNANIFNIYRLQEMNDEQILRKNYNLAFGSQHHIFLGSVFFLRQLEISINIIIDTLNNLRFSHIFQYQESGIYTRGTRSLPIAFHKIDSKNAIYANKNTVEESCI